MKKINDNKVLFFFVQFISNTIFALIIWPLLSMFFKVVIYKEEFVYSVTDHIISPVFFGLFLAIFSTIMKPSTKKK